MVLSTGLTFYIQLQASYIDTSEFVNWDLFARCEGVKGITQNMENYLNHHHQDHYHRFVHCSCRRRHHHHHHHHAEI